MGIDAGVAGPDCGCGANPPAVVDPSVNSRDFTGRKIGELHVAGLAAVPQSMLETVRGVFANESLPHSPIYLRFLHLIV